MYVKPHSISLIQLLKVFKRRLDIDYTGLPRLKVSATSFSFDFSLHTGLCLWWVWWEEEWRCEQNWASILIHVLHTLKKKKNYWPSSQHNNSNIFPQDTRHSKSPTDRIGYYIYSETLMIVSKMYRSKGWLLFFHFLLILFIYCFFDELIQCNLFMSVTLFYTYIY